MDFPNIGQDIASAMKKPNPIETEKIKQLREINSNLRKEIDFAIKQSEDAKKESAFSKRIAVLSFIISVASAAAAILPLVF